MRCFTLGLENVNNRGAWWILIYETMVPLPDVDNGWTVLDRSLDFVLWSALDRPRGVRIESDISMHSIRSIRKEVYRCNRGQGLFLCKVSPLVSSACDLRKTRDMSLLPLSSHHLFDSRYC